MTTSPGPAARQAQAALACAWHLAVLRGPDAGLVLALPTQGTLVVGRGEIITDPFVSRRHLRLRTRPAAVTVSLGKEGLEARWRRRRLGPLLLPGAGGLAAATRWREGERLQVGSTLLELRRRPSRLVAGPARARRRISWQHLVTVVGALLMVVVVLGMLLVGGGTGRRWPAGLMVVPMLLMAVSRLGLSQAGASGRRQGATGWRGKDPDLAQMLVLLARPRTTAVATAASSGETTALTAWLARRRRRNLLELEPGECQALCGPQASGFLTWWCAQVVAAGLATARPQERGWQLWWQAQGNQVTGALTWSEEDVPASATAVRAQPRWPHPPSPGWTRAATGLIARAWQVQAGRGLAPTGPEGRPLEAGLPAQVPLASLTGVVDQDLVAQRWALPAASGRLPAVLGVTEHEQVVADLVEHGPHALLAGTTGSGKSELLRSWLLQLAVALPPQRLSLVLVDYKGGAAFGPLTRLPHTAGVLTDLDPALTTRALASLEAEVRRRESLLARLGVADLAAWEAMALPTASPEGQQGGGAGEQVLPSPAAPPPPPPRVVIAVDEFATLASSHPQVLDGLVRVAAQGRSLGMHLVLATQRPGGAVSQTVRANVSVRVCLRVLDAADSRDVLDHAQASLLSTHPGRLMVSGLEGAEGLVLQAPWCGAPQATQQSVEEMVAELGAAARGCGARPWRPWADPLPEHVQRPGNEEPAGQDGVMMALVDQPHTQSTTTWSWSASQPLAVLGSPGSGRSTALASAALGFLACTAPEGARSASHGVHLCGLPEQVARRWPALAEGAAGVGTVVGVSDPRRLARLWELAAAGTLSGDLLVLDDVDRLAAAVDACRGPGEGLALLEALIRASASLGTHLALSAPLSAASARWATTLPTRLVLGASQASQAAVAGLPHGVRTGDLPGRGVLLGAGPDPSQALECQVLLPAQGEAGQGPAPAALKAIPLHLRLAPPAPGSGLPAAWAVGGDEARPLDPPCGSVLVMGPAGSGRSTTLRVLEAVCVDDAPLVVDDLDLCTTAELSRVEQALVEGRTVLASALTERVATSFRGALAELRARADLVVLWPGVGPAAQAAGVSLRAVCDPQAPTHPGRGALVRRGQAVALQVACPAPAGEAVARVRT